MAGRFVVAAALVGAAAAAAVPVAEIPNPVEERQACATQWGQCGGIGFGGPSCCASGNFCSTLNPYYAQCLSGSGGGPTTTTTTTTTTKATTTTTTTTTSMGGNSPPPPAPTSSSKPTSSSSPATSPVGPATTTSAPAQAATTAAWYPGNPFSGVQQWANAFYASEVENLAIPSLTGAQVAAASAVAQVPSFQWLDQASKVDTLMADTLASIRAANQGGASPPYAGIFVVYDLPNRDCAAAASNGEYSIADNGVANYKAYIDAIYAQVTTYSDVRVIFVVEPDSLANMVTNLSVQNCQQAEAAYFECVNYAITKLNVPNVAMYLDAGHAGWLGWSANLQPAATLFAQVYKNASSPTQVRGLATNVANYNAWQIATAPSYTSGDSNYDESLYVQAISPLLNSAGFSAHFITDQSRSGVQPTKQQQWGDWCNVIGTGFGTRPTTNTGLAIEDAFVWVKPGGECDGTSNSSAPRYDFHCGYPDALQPAPQAGSWFQAYFEQLLTNANPSFM